MTEAAHYKDPIFDDVHACQDIFTTVMMAMAYPGTIRDLRGMDLVAVPSKHSFVLQPFITLLDLETSHHVAGEDTHLCELMSDYLEANTHSNSCSPELANFVLCLNPSARSFYSTLSKGSLTSPDHGATIVYQVEELSVQGAVNRGTVFTLEGPGVKSAISLDVQGLDQQEPLMWQSSRRAYPLGIDVLLVSSSGKVVGIPRSVRIIQPGVN